MSKVSLPDGAWAVMRDPAKVPERLRRPVMRVAARMSKSPVVALAASGTEAPAIDEGDLDLMLELNDLCILALVESWSFGESVTADALGDLDGDAYDALRTEAAKHMTALLPSFAVDPDPASPTEPSSA